MATIRRTYKYRLYESKHNKHLDDAINVAGIICNHVIALQPRYYKLTGNYISLARMQAHIGKYGLVFETLNIQVMQRLWGRKISDLGFSEFLKIVEHVARMREVAFQKIDQWTATSKTCSHNPCLNPESPAFIRGEYIN